LIFLHFLALQAKNGQNEYFLACSAPKIGKNPKFRKIKRTVFKTPSEESLVQITAF